MKNGLLMTFHLILISLASCDKEELVDEKNCPPYEVIPFSPYDDPVWHPFGEFIGFNHRPIKEIQYTNGYNCPRQANYIYEADSAGFWLVDADGENQRRVLPFALHAPAWSPDGKWIAFVDRTNIFKMPFDGHRFDTTAIVQLTFDGRNVFPAWSPDQSLIAYDNTDCGSATTPIPPNGCGILVMDTDGNNVRFVGPGRMPYWDNTNTNLYSYGVKYDLSSGASITFFNAVANHVSIDNCPKFNPSATAAGFIGNYTNTKTQFLKLFSVTPDGKYLTVISDNSISKYSWSPDGRIVYLNYDHARIDDMKGTLWTMDFDGTNQRQLTFNNFKITY